MPGSVVCALALAVPTVAGALPAAADVAKGVRNCVSEATFTCLVGEGGMLLPVALDTSSIEVGAGLLLVLVRSTSTKGKGALVWKENRMALLAGSVRIISFPAISVQLPAVVQVKVSSESGLG